MSTPQVFEVQKHTLRQTKEGVVVSFVVHPNDVTPELLGAPLGQRYYLTLVPIEDDAPPPEPLGEGFGAALGRAAKKLVEIPEVELDPDLDYDEPKPAPFPAVALSHVLCREEGFRRWMSLRHKWDHLATEEQCAFLLRKELGIKTRAELKDNAAAAKLLFELRNEYELGL